MGHFIVNTVRRQHTRHLRRMSPTRHRFTQKICGGEIRLVRNNYVEVSEAFLNKHRVELQGLCADGYIEIRRGAPNGKMYIFGGGDAEVSEATAAPEAVETSEGAGAEETSEPDREGEGEVAAEAEVTEEAPELPDEAPDGSWTKTKLLEYATSMFGSDHAGELGKLTKREILEQLS